MAKKEFILQGFTARTHADAVRELFDVADINRVVLSIAFVNESGVQQIESKLKANAANVTVYAGIRNDITSHQGLSRLHGIGVNLYTIDTGSRNVIFHPKLYLVRGKKRARLIVGSANLTLGGLNNNVEAGMMLDLNLAEAADTAVVDEIQTRFSILPHDYPMHIAKIGKITELDEMLASGRLIDERAPRPPRPTTSASKPKSDTVPRIKLEVLPLYGLQNTQKNIAKKANAGAPKAAAPAAIQLPISMGGALTLVWTSKPLQRRSLAIPSGPNSNPTGSTTLGKGALKDIDPVTYFRKSLFGALDWEEYVNKAGNKSERADATFDLVIKGAYIDAFSLTIRHSLRRVKAAKEDKNLPTEISWNKAIDLIRREDLLGRVMRIFRSNLDMKKFLIDID